MSWRQQAACKGHPEPDIFYPAHSGRPAADMPADTARALEICGRCKVSMDCLTEAIQTADPFGIRGGLLPHERGVPSWRR